MPSEDGPWSGYGQDERSLAQAPFTSISSRLARDQLEHVRIKTNALFSYSRQGYLSELSFGILQSWGKMSDSGVGQRAKLYVKWNQDLLRFYDDARFKQLNVAQFFSLKSSTSKRLYRWVDSSLFGQDHLEIDVFRLAHVRIGISESRRYVSQIMETLAPALDEVAALGIYTWELLDSQTDSGKKIRFTAVKPSRPKRKNVPDPNQIELLPPEVEDRGPGPEERFKMASEGLTDEQVAEAHEEAIGKLDSLNLRRYNSDGGPSHSSQMIVYDMMAQILNEKRAER